MLEAGQHIAHFHIVRPLGAGGMGEVYLAEDTKLQRYAALKILPAEYFEDQERKERFYREARTAAKITHPHVTAIYDMGSAPDPTSGTELNYIVMEYVEGSTLTEYIHRAGSDMSTVVRLGEQIASGLAAAHKSGIVHRDIKADNILVDSSGSPKILDFGLAKPVTPMQMDKEPSTDTVSQELTRAGKIVGTISYMSPEQIRGEAVDTRSDVFSFGILLYRMATGSLPFEGESQVSTLAKILETSPAPPRIKNDKIPQELERIIVKCLQKSADDRYQDTRDLVVDLRNVRREFDSSISTRTSAITDRPTIDKRSRFGSLGWKLAGLMIIILLVVGGIYQFLFHSPGSDSATAVAGQNSIAILDFENKTGSDDLGWLKTGLPEILLTDLSQSQAIPIISLDRIIDRLRADGKTPGPDISHSDGMMAAKQLGAQHALSGAYYKLGNEIRIDARLEDVNSGQILVTTKVMGQDPFTLVDSLTHKVAQSLNVEDKMAAAKGVANYTSSSPEAYKQYLAAMVKFDDEFYDDAIDGFKQAIALDSTFALPYMRIAMAYAFRNQTQASTKWFSEAARLSSRLPAVDRSLLDVYIDVWQKRNYNDAFIKMEVLVRDNPHDKECRIIYALLIQAFTTDTSRVMAQLDTALQLDPQFLLALTVYANLYQTRSDYQKVMEFAGRAGQYHPDSPTPYQLKAGSYYRQGKYREAIAELRTLQGRFPKMIDETLANLYIQTRDFQAAKSVLEDIKRLHPNDPYRTSDFYYAQANLAYWEGNFKSALEYHKQSLAQLLSTKDSNLVYGAYGSLIGDFGRQGMKDSSHHYSKLAFSWATVLERPDAAISLAIYAPVKSDSLKTLYYGTLDQFKKSLPPEIWYITDYITDIFEGFYTPDTTRIIKGFESAVTRSQAETGNRRELGKFYVLTKQYQKAIDNLLKVISGNQPTTSASSYLLAQYYLGIAYQGLGKKSEAKACFTEFLKYWGKPDIEIKEIRDAKVRLASLSG
jgi:eukaryotic-like serine/threonine-protein kinase